MSGGLPTHSLWIVNPLTREAAEHYADTIMEALGLGKVHKFPLCSPEETTTESVHSQNSEKS